MFCVLVLLFFLNLGTTAVTQRKGVGLKSSRATALLEQDTGSGAELGQWRRQSTSTCLAAGASCTSELLLSVFQAAGSLC